MVSLIHRHPSPSPLPPAPPIPISLEGLEQISFKRLVQGFKDLPDDLQEKIISRGALARDIADFRKPDTPDALARQMLRLLFLKHSPETARQDDAVLRFSLRKNLKALFKINAMSDIPMLMNAAVQARNDQAFNLLLDKMNAPLPPETMEKTLRCLADYGQPDKLQQVLDKQREGKAAKKEPHGTSSTLKKWMRELRSKLLVMKLRYIAQSQQKQIQRFKQLPAQEALRKLIHLIRTRGKGNGAGLRKIIALLQRPDLLPKGCPDRQINQRDIFSSAIYYADMNVVNALLADPHLEVGEGEPNTLRALHLAVSRWRLDIVKTLLELPEVNVNAQGADNNTPLHYAVRNYYRAGENGKELLKMLLSAPGVDVNQRNQEGQTPLRLALWLRSDESESGNQWHVLTEIINLLQEHGASE